MTKITIRSEDTDEAFQRKVCFLKETHNYREITKPKTCGNCQFVKSGPDQGDIICPYMYNGYVDYNCVCDIHQVPTINIPTAKEIALAKLTNEDKKALGLI